MCTRRNKDPPVVFQSSWSIVWVISNNPSLVGIHKIPYSRTPTTPALISFLFSIVNENIFSPICIQNSNYVCSFINWKCCWKSLLKFNEGFFPPVSSAPVLLPLSFRYVILFLRSPLKQWIHWLLRHSFDHEVATCVTMWTVLICEKDITYVYYK